MSLLEEELQAEADESKGAAAAVPGGSDRVPAGCSAASLVPILTTVIAFIAGGLIVLATGHNPLSTYTSIFNGTGLNWLFPWVTGSERATAAGNLQQTLLQATSLILVGPRGRVRVPRRHVQHRRPGPIHRRSDRRRLGRLLVRRDAAGAPHRVRDRRRRRRRRCVGRDRRGPEGGHRRQRGDLDDHAQLDRDLARRLLLPARWPAAEPAHAVDARVEQRRRRGEAAGLLGQRLAPGARHRDLHLARARGRVLGC